MASEQDWSIQQVAAIISSVGAIAAIPGGFLLSAHAQTAYPDVPADYWAHPFIQELSAANILTGYLDGTFRPEQAIDRDEYAAVIRQAFEAETVRSLADASDFTDVPNNYWASAAIEEAYETGFMDAPSTDEFQPQTELTRADAIVALVEGVGPERLMASAPAVAAAPTVAIPAATPAQRVRRRKANYQLMFPLASTTLMQLFAPPAQATPSAQAASPSAQVNSAAASTLDLSEYYADADQIPDYARDEIATATQANIIVNYPDVSVLNPNGPISRAGVAAMIHRVLENQNEMEPLPESSEALNYVVDPSLTH